MPSVRPSHSPLVKLQRWWLFALLLVIPFSLHYITEQPAAISYLNLISVGFIGLGMINLLFKTIPYTPVRDKGTLTVIGLLIVAMAFALFFTHPLRNGIGLWTSRLLQPMLVGWIVYQMLSARVVTISEIIKTLFLSIVPLVIGGALQAVRVIPAASDPTRITVLYQYPNTFARYVDILLLTSLPWIVLRKRVVAQWEVAIWLAGFLLLLTTKSYNGTVSLVGGIVVVLLLLDRSYTTLKTRALGTIAVLSLLVVANASKLPKWQASITDSRLSRLEFWHIAGAVIRHNFWTGIGIKGWETNYTHFVLLYGKLPPLNWVSQQPHNVFLDSMLKAGPLGLIAVTILLLWPIWRGLQLSRIYSLERGGWFGLSMVAYGVGMFMFGFIDDPLWSDDITPLLYIFLACLAWMYVNRANPKEVSAQL